jgi:TRAP-type C4-dicarboxylate transport system permease small subunit
LSKKRQALFQVFSSVIALFFTGVLTWFSTVTALESFHEKEIYSLTFPMPLFPYRAFIPIGGFLLFVAILIKMWAAIAAFRSNNKY